MEATEAARLYLHRSLDQGRVAHAWLLLGPRGSANLDFALELARSLFCLEPRSEPGQPRFCGRCSACRAIEHGNHPGVERYGPEADRSIIDIRTVRALCERSHYSREHAFVAIIDQADLLNPQAANALLKTLEEPAGDFILVLVASSSGSLLPTIVSRCHRLHFPASAALPTGSLDREVLAEVHRPGFLARTDPREWLARAVPGEKAVREQVRTVLGDLACGAREQLGASSDASLDLWIDRLELVLELRAELDRNVNADLVFERWLDAWRVDT